MDVYELQQPEIVDADVNHVRKTKGYKFFLTQKKCCKCNLIIKAASRWGLGNEFGSIIDGKVMHVYGAYKQQKEKQI